MKINIVALCLFILTARSLPSENPVQLPPASEMKMIGLVGGTSWYSTVEYYRYINKAVNEAYGNNTNPPLIVLNLNQHRIHELQNKDQWDEIATIRFFGNFGINLVRCVSAEQQVRLVFHGGGFYKHSIAVGLYRTNAC